MNKNFLLNWTWTVKNDLQLYRNNVSYMIEQMEQYREQVSKAIKLHQSLQDRMQKLYDYASSFDDPVAKEIAVEIKEILNDI
jgi:hypothetical protein